MTRTCLTSHTVSIHMNAHGGGDTQTHIPHHRQKQFQETSLKSDIYLKFYIHTGF